MRLILLLTTFFISVCAIGAQQLPAPIRSDLDSRFPAASGKWRAAPAACEPKAWFQTADFNGDGRIDYALRVTAGRAPAVRLVLIAYIAKGTGFDPLPVVVEPYDTFRNSSFEIVRKGKTVNLGLGAEGEGPSIRLEADGLAQFICRTDGIRTFIYRGGKMIDVRDLGQTGKLNEDYPYPVLVAEPVPDLSGRWRAFGADGKPSLAGQIRFTQTGPKVVLDYPDGYKYPARIRSGTFILDLDGTGTIENGGTLIRFRNGTYFQRAGAAAAVGDGTGIPKLEQDCLDRVRAAGLNLKPTASGLPVERSLELLCAATENPPATVDCFRRALAGTDIEIAAGRCTSFRPIFEEGKEFFRNANRARLMADGIDPDSTLAFTRDSRFAGAVRPPLVEKTAQSTSVVSEAPGDGRAASVVEPGRLVGRWKVYGPSGAQVPLTEASFAVDGKVIRLEVKSENYTRRATASLEQAKILTGWNTTGFVSSDHRRITWSDGTEWRKVP